MSHSVGGVGWGIAHTKAVCKLLAWPHTLGAGTLTSLVGGLHVNLSSRALTYYFAIIPTTCTYGPQGYN